MSQMNYSVLDVLHTTVERQTAPAPARKHEHDAEKSSFQKMLDAKAEDSPVKEQVAAGQSKENAEVISANAAGAGEEDTTDLELQNQMVWAALMALQQPVVAMESVQQAPQADPQNVLVEGQPVLDPAASCAFQTLEAAPEAEGRDVSLLERALRPERANEPLQETSMKPAEQEVVVHHRSGETPVTDAALSSEEKTQQTEFGEAVPVFRDIDGIPVKVGEAPVLEQSGKEQPVEAQLFERLSTAVDRGETKVDIQLEPENLGHVQVEMTWSKDGALRVSMHAESSQTQKLLERDVAGLEVLLSRNGQQEVTVEVNRQQESARQDLDDGHPHGGSQQEQQPDHPNKQKREGQDFLQQLRLGLIPVDEEVS